MIFARLSSVGEIGFGMYYIEKEKLDVYSSGRIDRTFTLIEHDRPFGLVQFYRGHAPQHVAGMSVIVFEVKDRKKGKGKMAVADAIVQYLSLSDVQRLEVYTEIDNVAACKGAEALGFSKEGVLKSWYPRNGELKDAVLFAKVK